MMKKLSTAAIVGVLVCAAAATPTSAEEQAEEMVEVVQQAEENTFDTDTPNVDVVESGDGFKATVEGGQVEIPGDSDDPIEIESEGGSLEIGLPGTKSKKGTRVGESVAYSEVEKDLGLVVDAVEGGVRLSVVIETPAAPHTFDFSMEVPNNGYLQLEDDGSVSIRDTGGVTAGSVDSPWATDAQGESVQTWYSVDGNVLTQHVQPSSQAVYPITADPWYKPWTWTWSGIKREMKQCGTGAVVVAGGLGLKTVGTNTALYLAGKGLVAVSGGGYAYVGAAVGGCIVNALRK